MDHQCGSADSARAAGSGTWPRPAANQQPRRLASALTVEVRRDSLRDAGVSGAPATSRRGAPRSGSLGFGPPTLAVLQNPPVSAGNRRYIRCRAAVARRCVPHKIPAKLPRRPATEIEVSAGSSPPLAIRRSGPIRVWAGEAGPPAQTPRNPQETNGMSRAPHLANSLQIDQFRAHQIKKTENRGVPGSNPGLAILTRHAWEHWGSGTLGSRRN